MKLLDGNILYPEIELIDNTIDTIQGELTTTKSAIMDLIALEDDLKVKPVKRYAAFITPYIYLFFRILKRRCFNTKKQ